MSSINLGKYLLELTLTVIFLPRLSNDARSLEAKVWNNSRTITFCRSVGDFAQLCTMPIRRIACTCFPLRVSFSQVQQKYYTQLSITKCIPLEWHCFHGHARYCIWILVVHLVSSIKINDVLWDMELIRLKLLVIKGKVIIPHALHWRIQLVYTSGRSPVCNTSNICHNVKSQNTTG